MTAPANTLDPKAFRAALGRFATGVTIIPCAGPEGRAVGLTANSFSALSLDPPLVLWSLRTAAMSMPAFARGSHYAIHILAAEQLDLAKRFATRDIDRFSGLAFNEGAGGVPLMWMTGHSLMKAKLKETGAPLAGEMSGHIFFKERWYGFDDGLYAGARLLERGAPGLGQHQRAALRREQGLSQLLFEHAELGADGLHREIQALRRAGDAALLGNGPEVQQVAEIEVVRGHRLFQ